MGKLKISIATEYSLTPGPRLIKEGPHSAENFNNEIFFPRLEEAIKDNVEIDLDLDGVLGYATSFLDEVFGSAVKKFGYEEVKRTVNIISKEEPYLIDDIRGYMEDAKK